MRTALSSLIVALALLVVCPARGGDKDSKKDSKSNEKDKASIWMKEKLNHSQQILAGLTKEDFEMIRKNADALLVVGYLEKSDRAKDAEYRRQIRNFEDATKELIRQAEKKNLGGATLAYTQMTLSCVQCHTVVRDAKK
jgi:hypothetical protein